MTLRSLVARNLRYFWRTHVAVAAGVAVAVGVLTGSLLVGDSVRGSLRELFVSRLGRTDDVVVATGLFREALAEAVAAVGSVETVPVIAFEGMVTHPSSGRRSTGVQVYGVDERFWAFHGARAPELSGREALLTKGLAAELGSSPGDAVLLRVERPTEVSSGSLHGVKENTGRTLRLTVATGLAATGLPEFSLYPRQDAVRAIFVPLDRLQRDLGDPGRVNALLSARKDGDDAARLREAVRASVSLEDLSVRLRPLETQGVVAVESEALMLSDPLARAVRDVASETGAGTTSVLTYLANTLRVGEREVPYSLVAAVDEGVYRSLLEEGEEVEPAGVVLDDWAASRLGARAGAPLTMEYYVWRDEGRIETESAELIVRAVVPMEGLAADRDLAPDYPGISETENLSDWEPPFPIDLSRVGDDDEAYWDAYRATPKAFVPLALGQRLWPVRQGRLTSIRLAPPGAGEDLAAFETAVSERLLARLDPFELGFQVLAVRERGLEAARGATDFGQYFVYFSYFLVVAALLLTGLFFKLGVEQRFREVGTLLAMGFPLATIRRVLLAEGLVLSFVGAIAGTLFALLYAGVILYGLRTFWVDAVGTRLLTLHVGAISLVAGLLGGVAAALFATWLTLGGLSKASARSLLAGEPTDGAAPRRGSARALALAVGALAASLGLVAGALFGAVPDAAGFFGAGSLLLASLLAFEWLWLRSGRGGTVSGTGTAGVARLGVRNASHRPGRTLVAVALIAFATFVIVAVDAFRKHDGEDSADPRSGGGGYALVAESLLPLYWDPNSDEGRNAYNLPYPGEGDAVSMTLRSFRLRPGDDASCLNLYRPQSPRVVAVSEAFRDEGRFRFAASLAETAEERANPWRLLDRRFDDGAVPVIGDQNSMSYVLHLGLGDDFSLPRAGREPLTLRLVATLRDSVFQGELLMSEEAFVEAFPSTDGFRFFLVEAPRDVAPRASVLLEERLSDYGLDARSTAETIASFHRVENTYLSTFQSLGGLGLVLGTFGLAAILLRNILERRRELALLRAVGYRRGDFAVMVFAENALVLLLGLLTGSAAALVAIAPAWLERGGGFGVGTPAWLLGAVLVAGLLASAVAIAATLRAPLLPSLRAE